MKRSSRNYLRLFMVVLFFGASPAFGYSVLTHEAIIDANWEKVLAPLIKQKFPPATPEDLKNAHAFAYGGSVMPDMGYYPFGSKIFTNLIHYSRSGDFVENLFKEAEDINEYAFALGVLCHYYADTYGHQIGINRSVPLIYPKLKKKFGDTVTYADDKLSHLRTEFSFDVLQTARGNYAPLAYHDFIGFQVSKDLIEKAFRKTYGLEVKDLFGDFDRAVGSFRWSVKSLIPSVTKAAWKTKRREIRELKPLAVRHSYIYRLGAKKYYDEFGRQRDKPGFGASLLSFFIRIAPKVGPLKILKFKVAPATAEKRFIESFDATVSGYNKAVAMLNKGPIELANIDWDTGKKTMPDEYRLADKTYSDWVIKLKEKNFETITPSAKRNILSFYRTYSIDPAVDTARWQQTNAAIKELKTRN